jgi:hypothetical protein
MSFTLRILHAIGILLGIYVQLIALETDNILVARNTLFANAWEKKLLQEHKGKSVKINAAIWLNKMYRINQLKPKYAKVKVNGYNRHSMNTKNSAIKCIQNEEFKFLYMKIKCSYLETNVR